jgi:serine/threonine protein kinase
VTDEGGRDHLITLEEPAPLHDLIGKRWETRFRFVRLIGCGGMGEVWAAASDDIPGHLLAVKVIALEHAHRPDVLGRFFSEAVAASVLNDPNVIKIDGTGRLDDGRPVLLMEYIDGASIQSMVEEQGPLPIDTIGQVLLQAASALRATHAKGIIHRDIKPGNMLVSRKWGRTNHLTVVDFGIAKLVDPELAGKIKTKTKMFMGTPGYLAPEQAHGRAIDAKVDTYALGVVLYFMLTGRLPYEGDSALEILSLQAKAAPFPPPSELRHETPPAWNALVRDCVQLDPARRPTAVEIGRRIANGLASGKSLLKSLAPEIAVHRGKSAVFAATLSIDVPTALSQLSAQYDVPQLAARKRERIVRTGLAAAGVLIGSFMTAIALRLASPAEHACPAPQLGAEHGVTAEDGFAGAMPPSPADCTPGSNRVAGYGSSSAGEIAERPSGSASSTVRVATADPPRPPNTTPAGQPGSAPPRQPAAMPASQPTTEPPRSSSSESSRPPSTAPSRQPTIEAPRPLSSEPPRPTGTGTLVITAVPFADVTVDGRPRGTTPLSLELPPRVYRVTLTGPNGDVKTQFVEVVGARESKVSQKW